MNMLVKVESAPFQGGKLRHSTCGQLFIVERKFVNSRPPMGTPENKEHTAAESPEIGVVDKRELLERPEDRAYIVLRESEIWAKKIKNFNPYSTFLRTAHKEVL